MITVNYGDIFVSNVPKGFTETALVLITLLYLVFDLQKVIKAVGLFAGSIFVMRNFGELIVLDRRNGDYRGV